MAYIESKENVDNDELDEEVKNVTKKVLIGSEQDAPNFIMRHFKIEEGGHSPNHSHDWEHEAYVLSGEGIIKDENGEHYVKKGDFAYISPNEEHQFENPNEDPFEFICVIPR